MGSNIDFLDSSLFGKGGSQMKIAVYGRIGSGKSTVAKMLSEFLSSAYPVNFPLISADEVAKGLYPLLSEKIKSTFGTNDRKEIAKIVFRNTIAGHQALLELNEIFKKPLTDAMLEILNSNDSVVVETPLLIEYEMQKYFDVLICVTASIEARRKRLVESRGMTLEEAQARIDTQGPQVFAQNRITITVSNDDIDALPLQIERLVELLQ